MATPFGTTLVDIGTPFDDRDVDGRGCPVCGDPNAVPYPNCPTCFEAYWTQPTPTETLAARTLPANVALPDDLLPLDTSDQITTGRGIS